MTTATQNEPILTINKNQMDKPPLLHLKLTEDELEIIDNALEFSEENTDNILRKIRQLQRYKTHV